MTVNKYRENLSASCMIKRKSRLAPFFKQFSGNKYNYKIWIHQNTFSVIGFISPSKIRFTHENSNVCTYISTERKNLPFVEGQLSGVQKPTTWKTKTYNLEKVCAVQHDSGTAAIQTSCLFRKCIFVGISMRIESVYYPRAPLRMKARNQKRKHWSREWFITNMAAFRASLHAPSPLSPIIHQKTNYLLTKIFYKLAINKMKRKRRKRSAMFESVSSHTRNKKSSNK